MIIILLLLSGVVYAYQKGYFSAIIQQEENSIPVSNSNSTLTTPMVDSVQEEANSAEIFFTRPIQNDEYNDYSLWRLDIQTGKSEKIVDIFSSNKFMHQGGCMELFEVSKTQNKAVVCKDGELFTINLASGEMEQVTQLAQEETPEYFQVISSPATLSSDGNLVAFEVSAWQLTAEDTGQDVRPDANPGLWILDLTTNEITGPIHSYREAKTACCGTFYFSKDNNFIIEDLAANDNLKIIDLKTNQVEDYGETKYSRGTGFNNDHSCAVLETNEPFDFEKQNSNHIVIDSKLKTIQSFTTFIPAESVFQFPQISPDCKLIAYEAGSYEDEQIYIYNIDKQMLQTKLSKQGSANGGYIIGWLPGNKEVTYHSSDSGDIYSVNIETRESRQLTNFGDINRGTARLVY